MSSQTKATTTIKHLKYVKVKKLEMGIQWNPKVKYDSSEKAFLEAAFMISSLMASHNPL